MFNKYLWLLAWDVAAGGGDDDDADNADDDAANRTAPVAAAICGNIS